MAKEYSCGVVIINQSNEVLLMRSFSYWDFPKGKIEAGEDPFDTALREVREETTLTDLEFAWGKDFLETAPYGKRKKIARYYVARLKSGEVSLPINPVLGKPEHNEFRWLPFDEAEKLVNERILLILQWAKSVCQ